MLSTGKKIISDRRWSTSRAKSWYEDQPWIVGCNFIPSYAVNQLEMWQAETFDLETVKRELGFAAGLGMNTVRVYLHDLAYAQDSKGFLERMERFLEAADSYGIRVIFVIFDDCWNPDPQPGKQNSPIPGIHNSQWVQSPGLRATVSLSERSRLETYVRAVVSAFAHDRRILLWDLYNEIGNIFLLDLPRPWYSKWPRLIYKFARFHLRLPSSMPLCLDTFSWVRDINPDQPLSCGVYFPNKKLNEMLLDLSDVITFHNYEDVNSLEKQIANLKKMERPLICTEWMARTRGSLVETHLRIFKNEKVGCCNWGLVSGKTQTIYSWDDPSGADRTGVWFHDLFFPDGRPYSEAEAEIFRALTAHQI